MAKFKQGDKVRLKQDYYKHDWFKAWDRENRKRISLGVNKVARITLEDMFVVCSIYSLKNVAEIRFNDRTYLQVHEDMLESVATKVTNTEHAYTITVWQDEIGNITKQEYKFNRVNRVNSSSKHSYTAAQIAEAQRIIGELVIECVSDYNILSDENKKKCWVTVGCNTYTARCSDGDEYNLYIGIMIALCRANGRKVPDWVYGNE